MLNDPNSYIEPSALDVDASGNVYSCGGFSGAIDFDPGPATNVLTGNGNGQDVFMMKQDASGNLLWIKSLTSSLSYTSIDGIAVDNNMNVYVTGTFDENVDFDPGPGTLYMTPTGFGSSYILKLNSNGQLVWVKFLDGINGSAYAKAITLDNNNNVYVSGSFDGQLDFDPGSGVQLSTASSSDGFILKLDASGNYIWNQDFTSTSYCNPISVAANNNGVYLTGYYLDQTDFDPGTGTQMGTSNNSSFDAFIVRLDPQGNYIQHFLVGGPEDDMPQTIRVDANGNMFVCGNYSGTCDFDPSNGFYPLSSNAGTQDPFIMKINANGSFGWAGLLSGPNSEQIMDMDLDPLGNVYTTGYFSDSIDLDPGVGISQSVTNGVEDIFYSKISNAGGYMTGGHLGAIFPDGGFSLKMRNYGIYVNGLYSGTVDFNPAPSTNTLTSMYAGSNDMFIYRWDQCTPSVSTINATGCTYTLNGQVYSGNGTYTQIIPNSTGCDSIITINLTGSTTNTHMYPIVCGQASYTYNGQTYTASGMYTQYHTNVNGCDSNTIIHLTMGMPDSTIMNETACDFYFFNNQFLTSSGVYTQTFTNSSGCDSTVILNLTLNTSSYQTITVNSCGPYMYNGQLYSSTGVYTNNFVSANGCDSTIDLDLTVWPLPNITVTQNSAVLTSAATAPTTYQWLTCNPYSVISGATSSSYTATANGSYAVEVSLNGCKDTSSCFTVSGLAVHDMTLSQVVKIWPNPVKDVLFIESEKNQDHLNCEVYSIAGQMLMASSSDRKKNVELSVKSLSAGVYFLHLSNGKEEIVFRFVKE